MDLCFKNDNRNKELDIETLNNMTISFCKKNNLNIPYIECDNYKITYVIGLNKLDINYNQEHYHIIKDKVYKFIQKNSIEKIISGSLTDNIKDKISIILKDYYNNFEVYNNGYGNIVIRMYGKKSNRCYRIPESSNNLKDELDKIIQDALKKAKIEIEKIKNREEKIDVSLYNAMILNTYKNIKIIYNNSYGICVINKENEIIEIILSNESINRRSKESVIKYITEYINNKLKNTVLENYKNKIDELKKELCNRNIINDKLELSTKTALDIINNKIDYPILNNDNRYYNNKRIFLFVDDIIENYNKYYSITKIKANFIMHKNCIEVIIKKYNFKFSIFIKEINKEIRVTNFKNIIVNKEKVYELISNKIREKIYPKLGGE